MRVTQAAVHLSVPPSGVRAAAGVQAPPAAALSRRQSLAAVTAVALALLRPLEAAAAPLFGPRAVQFPPGTPPPAPAAAAGVAPAESTLKARALATSPADAIGALVSGRDALSAATQVVGAPAGKRALLLAKLPRYSSAVQVMTAVLPVVFDAVLDADAVPVSPLASDQAAREGAYEDILIGAKNVVLMSRIAGTREFADDEVPQVTFTAALTAIDQLLAALPQKLLSDGRRARCRVALEAAQGDYEAFIDATDTVACDSVL